MSKETYVCAEPDQVTAYRDETGILHESRDAAIAANFQRDFDVAAACVCDRYPHMPVQQFKRGVELLVKRNPDLVRVLLDDRDPT